jgi:RNA polymerase sigma-70 factor (ECF subfamily)
MARPQPTTEPLEFEALVREGQQPVLRYLMARADSPAEANELAQETFVRAYCALVGGTDVVHPIPWLLAIARNVFLETLRNHRYERQLRERMGRMMGREWQSPWHDRVERRLVVAGALEGLPPELREPVLLHYFGGLSVAEVAGHLEITAGAVKTRLWRARQALRGELEVLVSDAKRKSAVFSIPRDLAAKAKLIAEQEPVYESVSANLHVGGLRWATQPMFEPLFPEEKLSWDQVQLAVERLRTALVAGDRPLAGKLELWPLMELFYHEKPIEVWSFLRSAEIGNEAFQESEEGRLVITDGWQLGRHPEAPKLLADFKEAGLRHIWFTFAGLRETHDDLCQRPGAFDAIVTAMERCREAGIAAGANLTVTTRNTGEFAELGALVRSLGSGRFVPTYPFCWWVEPEHANLQPEPDDLVGLPPEGLDVNWGYRDFWSDPEAFTEGALVRRAIESGDEEQASGCERRRLNLWVWPNLDLLVNDSRPVPTQRLANLNTDPPQKEYDVLANLEWPPDPPSDAELARRYGDPKSRKVFYGTPDYHNGLGTVRQKWLEAWRVDQRITWLPFPW